MPDVKATIEQRAAIGLRGGSLLVSAGAGSGKTWVLTQRLMAYIDPGHNGGDAADITDFLVITFTRAAAGELKTRIAEAISKAVAEESAKPEPDVKRLNHLRRQTALAAKAHISTIHSFCADMIRELGTAAGIRTDFRIIDDERAEAIKTTALNRVLEQRYSAPGNWPGFTDLSDKLCRSRDDRLLADLIRSTYEKLQSQAYPEVWIETQKQAMEKDYQDLAQSPWGRELISETRAKASFWKRKMDLAVQELLDENGKTMEKYMESFSSAAASLDLLCRAMDFENGGSWEKCREASKIEFVKLKTLRNPDDPDLQKRMFSMLGLSDEEAYKKFGFLTDAFKYGAPPHGGMGIGLDRLVMQMIKASTLRDVVAFPKVQNASELMTNAPSPVDDKQLGELGIKLAESND